MKTKTTKKTTKATPKANKPTPKAKAPAKAPKTPTPKPPHIEAAAEKPKAENTPKADKPPKFAPVNLPQSFALPNGGKMTITEKHIIVAMGLTDIIFNPLTAYQHTHDRELQTRNGKPQTIKAGWVSLVRGSIHIGIKTPEMINAILTAKAAAKAAKAKKGKGGDEISRRRACKGAGGVV